MAWTIYWLWVILAVYVWIIHVIKINVKIEHKRFAVRNFTRIWYYYKTSIAPYWWRIPNPKVKWTLIRKPKYFWVIVKNVFIWPWFSWIFIIKKVYDALNMLDYLAEMPNELKEKLNIINTKELSKSEMLKLVEEINKIGYDWYYFIPQDIRTEEEKKNDGEWKVILKDWETSIEISKNWRVCFKSFDATSYICTEDNTISFNPPSWVFFRDTDEYRIDWTSVDTRCIEYTDYDPEPWREKNGFDYKPIENWIVYESRIIEEKSWELAFMKDKKAMKEFIEKEINEYKSKAQWSKASWWISTAVLYANLDKKDFRKYIEIQLEKAKCAIIHLEDLCEKYWFTVEFDKDGYHYIPELRQGVKRTKKFNDFDEEYTNFLKENNALCSKSMVKMLEEYLNEDK